MQSHQSLHTDHVINLSGGGQKLNRLSGGIVNNVGHILAQVLIVLEADAVIFCGPFEVNIGHVVYLFRCQFGNLSFKQIAALRFNCDGIIAISVISDSHNLHLLVQLSFGE